MGVDFAAGIPYYGGMKNAGSNNADATQRITTSRIADADGYTVRLDGVAIGWAYKERNFGRGTTYWWRAVSIHDRDSEHYRYSRNEAVNKLRCMHARLSA